MKLNKRLFKLRKMKTCKGTVAAFGLSWGRNFVLALENKIRAVTMKFKELKDVGYLA